MGEEGGSKGHIYKGTGLSKNAAGQKSVASIPAKFETILYPGPRERKGFGSEARRFGDSDNDLPGPGRYTNPTTALNFKPESTSKKGMGAMLSKDQRFKHHRVVYTGPGPGQYKPQALPEKLDFCKSKTSAVFANKVPLVRPLPESHNEPSPGPGAYTGPETVTHTGQRLGWEEGNNGYKAAFKATPHNLKLGKDAEGPAPNQYGQGEVWGNSSVHTTAAARAHSKAGTSSFAGRGSVGSTFSHHVSAVPAVLFLEEHMGGPGRPDAGPGPGSYEVQAYGSIQTNMQRAAGRPTAAFQQTEFVDRFGRTVTQQQQQQAGPSEGPPEPNYRAQRSGSPLLGSARISSPPPGVGAPFRSASAGHGQYDMALATRAPGPAYYSPGLPPSKRSFHLNARKKFGL